MRLVVLLGILLTSFNYLSQTILKRSISGIVSAADNGESIKNAIIILKSSSGAILECKTDSAGKYRFEITNDSTSLIELICLTDKSTNSKTKSSCGWLAGKERHQFSLTQTPITDKNFILTKVACCGMIMPTVLFYTNSIVSCNDSLSNVDSAAYAYLRDPISILYQLLKENPTIIIELQGHASLAEKNTDQLALFRTQIVKEILIAKGIDRRRIMTKSWGTQKLLVKKDVIQKAKTFE